MSAVNKEPVADLVDTRIESRLRRIANFLLLNAGCAGSPGLYSGKTGIAIFFYHYARHTGNDVYAGYAGALIDEVYDEITVNTPVDFKNGLTGIGWGIEYLVENGFLEADTDVVLGEVDHAIYRAGMGGFSFADDEGSLFGAGLYHLARLRGDRQRGELRTLQKQEQLIFHVDECERILVHRGFSGLNVPALHIDTLNSILFFLLEMHRLALFPAKVDKLVRYVPAYIAHALATSRDEVARYVMIQLAGNIRHRLTDDALQEKYDALPAAHDAPPPGPGTEAVTGMVDICWNELLYAPYIDSGDSWQHRAEAAFRAVDDEAGWQQRLAQCGPDSLGLNGLAGIGQVLLHKHARRNGA